MSRLGPGCIMQLLKNVKLVSQAGMREDILRTMTQQQYADFLKQEVPELDGPRQEWGAQRAVLMTCIDPRVFRR